ncbi:hypothetical protein Tco_0065776 [Tanacetum coccineum]
MPRTMGGNDDEAGSLRSKRSRQYETVEEVLLPQVHHEFLLWEGCNKEAKSRINEEIFTSVAWIRAFNISEPIYLELCHEFYPTYKFDKVCADDELQTKKIIKFRLGGRAHSLTLLEFARRLGLNHAEELDEEGFDVSQASTIRSPVLRVVHKMITYSFCQRTTGEKELVLKRRVKRSWYPKQVCECGLVDSGQFITKIARKAKVLNDVVIRSLSAPIYCRELDTITLRELIDSEGRLIHEDPQPGVLRVAIPRPSRASMQDLYDRMGSMQARVFEHMAGVYSVTLSGAYNPPSYAQPQYDQYYQQYPPQPPQYPPQYQQQQQDDDE